jgi:parvulin-like peptidyl-prolyl isomerase
MTGIRLALAPLAAVGVLVAAGCGGGGGNSVSSGSNGVPGDAVATVAGKPITRAELDDALAVAKASYTQSKQTFPKAGTPEYQSLEQQSVATLVRVSEIKQEAAALGITITEPQVAKGVANLIKTRFQGQKKFDEYLKTSGFTLAQIRDFERNQLIETRLVALITKNIEVTDADVKTYYAAHKSQSPYTSPAQRRVRHILVAVNAKGQGVSDKGVTDTKVDFTKSKALADRLYTQLRSGANFATLVKKYSQDSGSKAQGGEYTDVQGTFVPEFEKSAFALKTREISKPVKSQYGYHLIQALAPTKPANTQTLAEATKGIRTVLLQQKRQTALNGWVTRMETKYKGKVTYAAGFEPPATTTTSTTTTPTTTP